ncbi:MAG: alpha/beta fold hydrolase [Opitutales bacterium]
MPQPAPDSPPRPFPITGESYTWTGPDGLDQPARVWKPESTATPAYLVVATHGLNGSAEDFEPLARALADRDGAVVRALNLRGMGNDPVPKRIGDLKGREATWIEQLQAFSAESRKRHPGLPVIWIGESLGSVITAHTLVHTPPDALPAAAVLAVPVTALENPLSWWQEALFRTMNVLAPWKRIDLEALGEDAAPADDPEARRLTRDAAYQAWNEQRPDKVDTFTLRLLFTMGKLIEAMPAFAPDLPVPTLVLSAGHDIFIRLDQVTPFVEAAPEDRVTHQVYPDSYHLLFHDLEKERVVADVRAWMRGVVQD